MIVAVYFDDYVVVPGSKPIGTGVPLAETRSPVFERSDGWDIREVLPGVFSLHREGMTSPATIGGYGYTYITAPTPEIANRDHESGARGQVPQAPQQKRGKR